jgi:ubiquinone/menaquinone biosynthesis C-methylase UbiE
MPRRLPPAWQLPDGVTRGLWDYVQAPHIATDYDEYFAENSLFAHDEAVLRRHFTTPGLVADLGCGTGRALVPLVRAGHRGLAIDLSEHMLDIVRGKAQEEQLDIRCLQANLVELRGIPDDSVDYAMCLFSTLGMVAGRANRQRVLAHVRRMLRPGGRFVLHVHNFWWNLHDPGGPWWVLRNMLAATFTRRAEIGDKYFLYRGVPNMFLHVFRPAEIRRGLRRAGFEIIEWIPLDTPRRGPLPRPWLAGWLRANGWIIVCQ